MENKKNIERLIKETLNSTSGIDMVKAPPFFKEKVLNKMIQTTTDNDEIHHRTLLRMRYQLIALVLLFIVNSIALLSSTHNNTYEENIENFAEAYGLSDTDMDSDYYQN